VTTKPAQSALLYALNMDNVNSLTITLRVTAVTKLIAIGLKLVIKPARKVSKPKINGLSTR